MLRGILRTGWVYGPVGRNFLLTMLRLHHQKATGGELLRVVADQIGCPTSTTGLAQARWAAIEHVQRHSLERCRVASWYDFAVAIANLAKPPGCASVAEVEPISTADYPTPARRPMYSLLDITATQAQLGLNPRHWRQSLQSCINELIHSA